MKTKQNKTKGFGLSCMGNLVVFCVHFIEIIIVSGSWKTMNVAEFLVHCTVLILFPVQKGWVGKFCRVQEKVELGKAN